MVLLSVFDYNRNKLMDIYTSETSIEGQAENVLWTSEINGWKELTFKIPKKVIDDSGRLIDNFRTEYIKNEYLHVA